MNVNKDELIEMQQNDPTISNICKNLCNRIEGPYSKINGVAIKHKKIRNGNEVLQIVIPQQLRKSIIETCHDSPLAGHMAYTRTLEKIRHNCFWPKMEQEVKAYTKSCVQCIRRNPITGKHKAPLQETDTVETPFEKLAMDIAELPTVTAKGNRYILSFMDFATRWPEAFPLKHIDASTICQTLLLLFTMIGFPRTIVSDNGTQFKAALTAAFAKLTEVNQVFSTVYHAQANSIVERWNKSMKIMLDKVCMENPNNWDEMLPYILFAYREAKNESTGFSPYELVHNRKMRGPLHLWKQNMLEIKEEDFPLIVKNKNQLTYAVKTAQENIKRSTKKHRDIKNKNRVLREFEEGDTVYVKMRDEEEFYDGPYTIEKKVGNVTYEVEMNGIVRKLHVNKLKGSPRREHAMVVQSNDAEECEIFEDETDSELNFFLHACAVSQHIETPAANEEQVENVLREYKDVITNQLGRTSIIQHKIRLKDYSAIKKKNYTIPTAYCDKVKEELNKLLKDGTIRRVDEQSEYVSPIVIVKKKDNTLRVCCDFRELNSKTVIDAEPLPLPEQLIEKIGSSEIFTTCDLNRGFWQIEMEERSKKFAAFSCNLPGLVGVYQWNVMPFGLVNSTATFQKCMAKLLEGIEDVVFYVDDICIFSKTWENHIKTLKQVLNRLRENKLTIAPDKLHIGKTKIEFLGYEIGNKQIRPTRSNLNKIMQVKPPETKKDIQAIIGLFNFYKKFISNYTQLISPLYDLLKVKNSNKDTYKKIIAASKECREAVDKLKEIFNDDKRLHIPSKDKVFELYTDASDTAIGACLMQRDDKNNLVPIEYLSRRLSRAETRYSTIEKECLAIVWCTLRLKRHLLGRFFLIFTDHKPLTTLNVKANTNSRITRWTMILADLHFEIKQIKGKDNVIADFMSRYIQDNQNDLDNDLCHVSQNLYC
ncbi:uncharacterized protein LOC129921719 [Biomphalaria glabrata]|uniref:Uncharacterized protein LOC129921719 n=1 Tax=Biomphalaria glabrata TaxID=6526 RepID=A0A9W2YC20_BIOGL|nr:uncharacterized protein LOC129921719 [Biomphalaria glabrata]